MTHAYDVPYHPSQKLLDKKLIRGHLGSLGSKNAVYTKKATFLTVYMALPCDSHTGMSLRPSTKPMGQKVIPRSFQVKLVQI